MPPGKPSESNAMLYTVITFVALFLIAATCAVIFYLKAEDYRTQNEDTQKNMDKFATRSEQSAIAKIVGKVPDQKSVLGAMDSNLNDMVSAITGQVAADTPASVKVNDAKIEINRAMQLLVEGETVTNTDNVDLVELITLLKTTLDSARAGGSLLAKQLEDLQNSFDDAMNENRSKEQQLIDENNKERTRADEIQARYDDLEKLMNQNTEEQVQNIMNKLEAEQARVKQKQAELVTTQGKLADTDEQLQLALSKLDSIKGGVNIGIAAFKPDARIVKIEHQANVVYLDIGSDDHVYPGLTFSVYDRSTPIPEDGKGKAEIEVFEVTGSVSAAKITSSSVKNPIVPEDIVANLIWDSKTSNRFVVKGDFDFDGDGRIDADGRDKITRLIRNWGGRIVDTVTIETDFVVLGTRPEPLAVPTAEEINLDPRAETKYETSVQKGKDYDDVFARSGVLSVPVINQQRFLHLIGYHSLAAKSTPF
jgi:hypothetical protein